jgi:hypothetical protein
VIFILKWAENYSALAIFPELRKKRPINFPIGKDFDVCCLIGKP